MTERPALAPHRGRAGRFLALLAAGALLTLAGTAAAVEGYRVSLGTLGSGPFYGDTLNELGVVVLAGTLDGVTEVHVVIELPAGTTLHEIVPNDPVTAPPFYGNCDGNVVGASEIHCMITGWWTGGPYGGSNAYLPKFVLLTDAVAESTEALLRLRFTSDATPNPPEDCSPAMGFCLDETITIDPSAYAVTGWNPDGAGIGSEPIATATGLEAGQEATLAVGFAGWGHHQDWDGDVELFLDVPPEVDVVAPGLDCTLSGRRITCIRPQHVRNQFGAPGTYGVISRISVPLDAPVPGPLVFYTGIGDARTPPPTDCPTHPEQERCGRLEWYTMAPLVPLLRVTHVETQPLVFGPRHAGTMSFEVDNIGGAAGAATHVSFLLPLDFQLDSWHAPQFTSCAEVDGDLAAGIVVRCSGSALAPEGAEVRSIILGVRSAGEVPVTNPASVLAAVDGLATADPGALDECEGDPTAAHCSETPVHLACAMAYNPDGIYCDGLELPPWAP